MKMQNKKNTKQKKGSGKRATIPVRKATKEVVDKLVERANKNRPGGKIFPDDLINYLITIFSDSDVAKLQHLKVTILDEEPRIKQLYFKQHGEVSDAKWELMKCSGLLADFFKAHSRVVLS